MTVSVASGYSSATGNGSNKVFSFTFRAQSTAEVAVYVGGVLQGSGYTVALTQDINGKLTGGGTVTFTNAPTNAASVLIASSPLFTQLIAFENAGAFLPATHDDALDRAAIRDIYLNARLDRALLLPWGEVAGTIPSAAVRAGMFLAFDVNGAVTVGSAQGPTGPAPNLSIGSVTGLATGATPTVVLGGSNPNYTLSFGIPAGPVGPAPGLVMGTITTGAAGSSASASFTGTGPYTLNLTLPRGDPGVSGALSNGTYSGIVVSSAGAALDVVAGHITFARMANLAGAGVIGGTAAGVPSLLTFATVKSQLALDNVDNTSDVNKPVSTAQQTALNTKADANNAVLTGDPVAPTATARDADTSLATTAFVDRLYDIDQVSKSAAYTLTLSDRGRTVSTTANVHVPPNSSVAFALGAFVELYNNSNSSLTVDFSSGTDVFRKVGSTTTVTTLTLAARSLGQLRKPSSTTEWLALGFA